MDTLTPQVASPAKPRRKSKPRTREQRRRANAAARQARKIHKALRARLALDEDAVLTFHEWCAINSFSERQGQRIIHAPGGPVVTQLSTRMIGISRRNNRLWLESREKK
jgi:hypothetical protein